MATKIPFALSNFCLIFFIPFSTMFQKQPELIRKQILVFCIGKSGETKRLKPKFYISRYMLFCETTGFSNLRSATFSKNCKVESAEKLFSSSSKSESKAIIGPNIIQRLELILQEPPVQTISKNNHFASNFIHCKIVLSSRKILEIICALFLPLAFPDWGSWEKHKLWVLNIYIKVNFQYI